MCGCVVKRRSFVTRVGGSLQILQLIAAVRMPVFGQLAQSLALCQFYDWCTRDLCCVVGCVALLVSRHVYLSLKCTEMLWTVCLFFGSLVGRKQSQNLGHAYIA